MIIEIYNEYPEVPPIFLVELDRKSKNNNI
jgi:hypothetical protein